MLRVKLFRIDEFYEPLENIETIIDRFGKVAKIIDIKPQTYVSYYSKEDNAIYVNDIDGDSISMIVVVTYEDVVTDEKIIEEVRDFLSNIIDLEEKTYKERIDKDKNCFWDLGERVENYDDILLADFICKMGIYCTPNQVSKALDL